MSKKLIYLTYFVLVLSLALSNVANAAVPGLIGWWKLDEMSGTIAFDSSGLGNDGIIGNPKWVTGYFGGALDLRGSGNYVAIDSVDNDFPSNNNFSFSVWIKTTQTSEGNLLAFNDSGSGHQFQFGISGGNVWIDDGPATTFPIPINDNQWHHLAYVRNGTTGYIYVDGAQRATDPADGNPSSDVRMSIGQEWDSSGTTSPSDEYDGIVDDAHIFNRPLTAEEVVQVMIGIPPGAASKPSPADEAIDVPRDVVLSWTPGEFAPPANGHKIYLSENFTDVNDGIGGVAQDANSYAPPQRLNLSTTYYWRVDEVNGPPDYTVYKGNVWSFTTELIAYPIKNVIATASSQAANRGVESIVNGSGLDASGLLHGKVADGNMWLSDIAGPQPTWIKFEFDKVYKLYEMWVWNSNDSLESMIGFGFKDVTIEYSANGTDYTTLGTTNQFARAPGAPDYAHNTTIDFGGVGAKYVRLTANSNWGGILPQYGLSEVRFLYIPVQAREPYPQSGATGVNPDVILGWVAGREAAKHNVYVSTDQQAVIDGTAPVATVAKSSYGPLSLDLGVTHYWRVDEVNEAETPTTWASNIWSFTTIDHIVVDDFESYNDLDTTDPKSNRIFNAWIDGYGVPTNGSIVGYENPPFAEKTIIHGGGQSMPLFYDNSGTARYSEATLTLSSQRDWTIKNVGALSLWFKGNPAGFVEGPAGTYKMSAAGVDIWGTADQFRFAWKQLTGDGSISAMVESVLWVPGANDWSKGGVMIRETLEPGSKNAFVALSTGAGDGATFQWRPTAGGTSSSLRTLVGVKPPTSVKLVRQGSTFTGYVFLNGQWQQEGQPATVAMGSTVYIGLALTSHSPGVTTEAVFSNVTTTGTVTGQFTQQAIGVDMPTNGPASMYVALASGGTPAVVYHDNPSASQIGNWTEWKIDLQAFAAKGVNLTRVNTITVGFGDKTNPQPGGSGRMYFDDIRLYPLP